MPAFSLITPIVMIIGINSSDSHGYQYLPINNFKQCQDNIQELVDKRFMSNGYGICLDTGLPENPPSNYGQGENVKVPYYLIAKINQEYEYIGMNDKEHCETNLQKLVDNRFVNEGWNTPYSICIKTGYPKIPT